MEKIKERIEIEKNTKILTWFGNVYNVLDDYNVYRETIFIGED